MRYRRLSGSTLGGLIRKKLPGFVAKPKGLIGWLKPRGDRLPATNKIREAYLTEWRATMSQSNQISRSAEGPVQASWKLRVEGNDRSARILVDGRYAGTPPRELSLIGAAGDKVRVEILRDDDILAATDITLHPLMPKVWKPV